MPRPTHEHGIGEVERGHSWAGILSRSARFPSPAAARTRLPHGWLTRAGPPKLGMRVGRGSCLPVVRPAGTAGMADTAGTQPVTHPKIRRH
ncbi:hypothetical protein VTN02DRAFT_63 [Thermoascus thermophilus]